MFCPKCGQQQPDNGQFCTACGSPLTPGASAPAAAPAPASGPAAASPAPSASPNIIENYKNVLRKYVTFEGRATRAEYWYFVLCQVLIGIVLSIVDSLMMPGGREQYDGGMLSNLYSLATFLPGLAVTVRRMHDIDRSGWWVLMPLVNFIFTLLDGTVGKNRYGADPKGRTA